MVARISEYGVDNVLKAIEKVAQSDFYKAKQMQMLDGSILTGLLSQIISQRYSMEITITNLILPVQV